MKSVHEYALRLRALLFHLIITTPVYKFLRYVKRHHVCCFSQYSYNNENLPVAVDTQGAIYLSAYLLLNNSVEGPLTSLVSLEIITLCVSVNVSFGAAFKRFSILHDSLVAVD